MKKVICIVLIVLLLAVFLFTAIQVLEYLSESDAVDVQNQQLIEQAVAVQTPEEPEQTQAPEQIEADVTHAELDPHGELAPIRVDFTRLWETNADITAWLFCEGTPINYPVVQSFDNDYYLRRLLDGSYNRAGTIFMDYRNTSDFSDWNTLVYGHNMQNSSMFGTFPKYADQSYYEAHPVIYLLTPEKDYCVELLAGYLTAADDPIYALAGSWEERDALVGAAVGRSDFKASVEIGTDDKIITFSTCSYETEDARYILVGVLKEIGT